MMTKEDVAQVVAYCDENNVSQKQRLEELGIPAWKFYDAKRKYAPKQGNDNSGEFLQLTSGASFLPNPIKPSRSRSARSAMQHIVDGIARRIPRSTRARPGGRKPARKNEKFKPAVLSTGDTLVELLTRTKYALTQTPDKWSERTKERMDLLFAKYSKIKQSYDVVNKLRAIFRSKKLTKDTAREKLHGWYKTVNRCTIREVKSARDAIRSREDNVLNYFIARSTNASAESLNSKMKAFRAQLRGVSDLPFFMYRLSTIFG